MALDGYRNLALAQVQSAPSPPSTGTALTLYAGQGLYFPTPPFNCTVFPETEIPNPTNAEIIRVTAMTGDTFTTILRAQESALGGPPARAIKAGDMVALTFSAKWIGDLTNADNLDTRLAREDAANTFVTDQVISGASTARLVWLDQSRPANGRIFEALNTGGILYLTAADDAYAGIAPYALQLDRLGMVKVGADLYEKGRTTPIGHWIDVPYSTGNFSASGSMTWTVPSGSVTAFRYTLIGKTMVLMFFFAGTSIGGTPSTALNVLIPGGYQSAAATQTTCRAADNNVEGTGVVLAPSSGANYIQIYKMALGNWTLSSGGTTIAGLITLSLL